MKVNPVVNNRIAHSSEVNKNTNFKTNPKFVKQITKNISNKRVGNNIRNNFNKMLVMFGLVQGVKNLSDCNMANATPEEFAAHGINVTNIDNDGLYTIKELNNVDKNDVKFITEHFNQIKEIEGNACFSNLKKMKNLGNLQKIGGNADFMYSSITDLTNLQEIGGECILANSKVTNLSELKKIGGNTCFQHSKLKTLGKLEEIGGDVTFIFSNISDLGSLKRINGNADFHNKKLTNLKNLRKIGGNASFENSKITNLGNLEKIGGSACFENVNCLQNLGNIQEVGGDLYVDHSTISDLGNLNVGGYIYFQPEQCQIAAQLKDIITENYLIKNANENAKVVFIKGKINNNK